MKTKSLKVLAVVFAAVLCLVPGLVSAEDQTISVNMDNVVLQSKTNYDAGVSVNVVNYNDNTVTVLSGGKQMKVTQLENPEVILTTFKYDTSGNLVSSEDNMGNVTSYDAKTGRQLQVANSDGFVTTTFEYNSKGSMTNVVNWGKDDQGKTIAISQTVYDAGKVLNVQTTEDNGKTWNIQTTYHYAKGTNNLVFTESKDGSKTYFTNGKQAYTKNTEGAIVQKYNYDSKDGKLISVQNFDNDTLVSVTKFDAHGRPAEVYSVTDGVETLASKYAYNDTADTITYEVDGEKITVRSGACLYKEDYINTYSEDGVLAYTQVQVTYFKEGDTQRAQVTMIDNSKSQIHNESALSNVLQELSNPPSVAAAADNPIVTGNLNLRDEGNGLRVFLDVTSQTEFNDLKNALVNAIIASIQATGASVNENDLSSYLQGKASNMTESAFNSLVSQTGDGQAFLGMLNTIKEDWASSGKVSLSVGAFTQTTTSNENAEWNDALMLKIIDKAETGGSVTLTWDFWSINEAGDVAVFVNVNF